MLGAAHKPGAMPLRPLGLGDIYDAAFRIIRFNPKATVGSAVLVAAVAMALPLLVTAAFTWSVDLSLDQSGNDLATAELAGLIGSISALGIGAVLQGIGTILVTGMIAHVTAAAAIGRRLSLGEAWRATHGKRWRLIGTSFLLALGAGALVAAYVGAWFAVAAAADGAAPVVIWGLLSVPAFICLLVWLWIRVSYLPVPALMLEEVGVFGALGRGFRLSRRQFWRIFGIALLTLLITGVASQVLGHPARTDRPGRDLRPRTAVRAARPGRGPGRHVGPDRGLRLAVQRGSDLAAVPRPAHPQGGLRRRADDPGGDHRVVIAPLRALPLRRRAARPVAGARHGPGCSASC